MSLTDEHKNHKQYNYTILNVIMKLNETKMRVLPSHICKILATTVVLWLFYSSRKSSGYSIHSKILEKLTRILPVVEIESCITNARARAGGSILRVTEGILSCHGREDNLILVKVDTNLEWSGEAAS